MPTRAGALGLLVELAHAFLAVLALMALVSILYLTLTDLPLEPFLVRPPRTARRYDPARDQRATEAATMTAVRTALALAAALVAAQGCLAPPPDDSRCGRWWRPPMPAWPPPTARGSYRGPRLSGDLHRGALADAADRERASLGGAGSARVLSVGVAHSIRATAVVAPAGEQATARRTVALIKDGGRWYLYGDETRAAPFSTVTDEEDDGEP
ncbi:MAG: hypothetical protein U0531_06955 [Dehalococcoidia bacterium]